MKKTQIRKEIESVLIQMGIPRKAITEKASYYKDLGLDSLDFTEMMMEFEVRFGLNIDCTALEHINTIKDTIDYVSGIMNKEKAVF